MGFYQFDQSKIDNADWDKLQRLANVNHRGGQVVFIDADEAEYEINRQRGLTVPGWWWVQTTDTTTGRRFRSELLAGASAIFNEQPNTGNAGEALGAGDEREDDAFVPDGSYDIIIRSTQNNHTVSSVSLNSNNIRVTTVPNHDLIVDEYFQISGITSHSQLNGIWKVQTVVSDKVFEYQPVERVTGTITSTGPRVRKISNYDLTAPLYWSSNGDSSYGNLAMNVNLVNYSNSDIVKLFSNNLGSYRNNGMTTNTGQVKYYFTVQEKKVNKETSIAQRWKNFTPSPVPNPNVFSKTYQNTLTGSTRLTFDGVLNSEKEPDVYDYFYRIKVTNTIGSREYVSDEVQLTLGEQTLQGEFGDQPEVSVGDLLSSKVFRFSYEHKGTGTGSVRLQLQTRTSDSSNWVNNDTSATVATTRVSELSEDIEDNENVQIRDFRFIFSGETVFSSEHNKLQYRVVMSVSTTAKPDRYERFYSAPKTLIVAES